ncbi:FAD-dependent monooxygenase [Streptomyces sp. NBC_00539]|uniref:FAD-dependent monooxygenase n=1 Tax=Streptomyces sp. NBC_00539 TaxID=2975770 RepID=UPI002E80438A|nr:FAD-dependent monooxygenase [Streptomyces sp. NBC_00539]WUC62763.1 FAD-dependent monooxygenase [Streptomyces sp. NBC_00539]
MTGHHSLPRGDPADFPVVVAGAGPVGLMTAAELALAGIRVLVVDKRPTPAPHPRALSLHARSLELLDRRGLAGRLLQEGRRMPYGHFAALPVALDFSVLDTPFPFRLALPQTRLEELLEIHARALGVTIRRSCELLTARQHPDRVEAVLRTPGGLRRLQAAYLVGCDGAHSTVRAQAGIAFTGRPDRAASLVADAVVESPPPPGSVPRNNARGVLLLQPVTGRLSRIVVIDEHSARTPASQSLTLDDIRAALVRVCGNDLGIHSPQRLTVVGDASHQAAHYRAGRILLAGDAAHAFFPAGGQGLNTGLHDAFDLGWKLAAQLDDHTDGALLDTYESERLPAGRQTLHSTRVQSRLMTDFTPLGIAYKRAYEHLLTRPEANRAIARAVAGLAVSAWRTGPTFEACQ